MAQVGDLLGPAEDWIRQGNEEVPFYWGYGFLEIAFGAEPPHPIQFLQIERFHSLQGSRCLLASELSLSLDGLSTTLTPSRLLQDDLWGVANAGILWLHTSDALWLHCVHGALEVIFVAKLHDDGRDTKTLAQAAESASIDSVYVHALPVDTPGLRNAGWEWLSGQDYLDLLGK